MYYPSLEEVKGMAGRGNLVPVYRSINADLETPVSAYLKVARGPYSYLLESVEGGERLGRYSFIGTEPYKVIQTGAGLPAGEVDPLILVEEEMSQYQLVPVSGLPGFHGGGGRLPGLRRHPIFRATGAAHAGRPAGRAGIGVYVWRDHPYF